MLSRLAAATLLALASLAIAACTEDDGDAVDSTATATTAIEGPTATGSGTTAVPPTSTAAVPTPEGTQAPTEIPLANGPPPLEADGIVLGLGSYCWTTAGLDEVCDEQDGIVTTTPVLTTRSAESINVTGFGQYDPIEASAQLWTRPEDGTSDSANGTLRQRTGDAVVVPVAPGTDAIAVTLDAPPGTYLLDLLVSYEEGKAEYGLQVDVE